MYSLSVCFFVDRQTDTYPKCISWAFPCESHCRRTSHLCLGWRAHVWSGGSASSPRRPGQSVWLRVSPLHSWAAECWSLVGGSRSHDRSGCSSSLTLPVFGCTPEPWVKLPRNRTAFTQRKDLMEKLAKTNVDFTYMLYSIHDPLALLFKYNAVVLSTRLIIIC